jgi:putative alpha-1,2-mannosidase
MAQDMKKHSDAEKYLRRSGNWKNMFRADQASQVNASSGGSSETSMVDSGFKGFLQPKYLNGTWGYQDPTLCSPMYNFTSCYLNPGGHEVNHLPGYFLFPLFGFTFADFDDFDDC